MIYTRALHVAKVPRAIDPAHPRIARRIELQLAEGQDAEVVESELADIAKRSAVAAAFGRREHVRRLDVELTGLPEEVDGVVQVLENRAWVRVMRDEVLPPAGTHDPLYPDAPLWRRVGAPAAPLPAPGLRSPVQTDRPKPVVVAIIDSGIMTEHPDLKAHLSRGADNRVRGRNLLADEHPQRGARDADHGNVEDEDGHGTLLAGTVLAAAIGSPAVQLLPVKFIDARTRPGSRLAAQAITWAVDEGAGVIDLSWEVGIADPALRSTIKYAATKNVLVVVAAGNSGADNDRLPAFPACYGHDRCTGLPEGGNQGLPNVITVMASDRFDDRAGFSNYGRKSVHIAAPGVNVTSTHQTLRRGLPLGDPAYYQRYDGSSAAAAFVAGAAARLMARNRELGKPDLTPERIKKILMDTADRRPDLPCKAEGRVNLARALRAL